MAAADLNARNSRVIADQVADNIAGQTAANKALFDIRSGRADPDLLHDRLQAVIVAGGAERIRAFMRVLQKRLEGTGA